MPTVLPPARADLSSTPSQSNAVAKAGLGKLWDWLTNLFGTTGTTAGALATLGAVAKAGDTLTGALNEAHGADIASAATINLTTATGNLVDVTGTVAITAITLADGAQRTVRFTGILTLTNGASLVLPGAANITTAAGDFAVFRGYAAGAVRCVAYTRADGTPLVIVDASTSVKGKVQLATGAEAITGTDALKALTPATLRSAITAPGTAPMYAARAWVNFNGTGTIAINASGNVSSITDNGVGDWTVNLTTALLDAFGAVTALGSIAVSGTPTTQVSISGYMVSSSSARVAFFNSSSGALADATMVNVTIHR